MGVARLALTVGLGLSTLLPAGIASAADAKISDNVIKIGVVNDAGGPYADLAGKGSVIAAQMAIDEMKGELPAPVELVSADHQLKVDVGVAIVKRWFDQEKVDAVVDIVHSAIALAAQQIAKAQNRIVIATAVGTVDFTGKACTGNTASWLYDTYALSNGLVRSLVANKLDTFYIIAVDYAFGQSMTNDVTKAAEAAGGKVLGVVKFPLNSPDFASQLLQAQSSGAKVVLLAAGGADLINLIKQSREFGITQRGQTVVTPLMFLTDDKGLGLDVAGGMRFSTAFYWNRNEETRAWSQKFKEKHGAPPTMVHAAVYSSVRHYLKAIKASGTDEAQAVMAKMRATPVDDMYVHGGTLREDGRLLHPMYLVEIKRPNESRGEWDYYKVISTIPAEQAFQSAKDGGCPLAK
jgi:branched-chain amino acid transport system substrate-binding protein